MKTKERAYELKVFSLIFIKGEEMYKFNAQDVIEVERLYNYSLFSIVEDYGISSITVYQMNVWLENKYNNNNTEYNNEDVDFDTIINKNKELLDYLIEQEFIIVKQDEKENNEEYNNAKSVYKEGTNEVSKWGEYYLEYLGEMACSELSLSDMLKLTPRELSIVVKGYTKTLKRKFTEDFNNIMLLAHRSAILTAIACFDSKKLPDLKSLLLNDDIDNSSENTSGNDDTALALALQKFVDRKE